MPLQIQSPPQPQPMRAQPMPSAAQWQSAPANPPTVVRGVAPEAPPAPPKFVLPRPEALGVATSLTLPTPTVAAAPAPVPVDWNQIQTRMDRLGVVGYHKIRPSANVVRVTLEMPTADPSRRQPIEAQGETEAAAVMSALQFAEGWAQRRGN